jgi:predicted alpha/beta-hydrolase family hydrolase
MMLPGTATQQRGGPGSFYCLGHPERPTCQARTQHVESVQKTTNTYTNGAMFRFGSDEKVASTGNCPNIGLLEVARDYLFFSPVFLVCCVAFGSALCACIDRVGLKGSLSTCAARRKVKEKAVG